MTQIQRDVFLATNENQSNCVVAIEFGKPETTKQTLYVFQEGNFAEGEFKPFKDELFDKWREGTEVNFPNHHTKIEWDIEKDLQYSKEFPAPQKEDKSENLSRKARRIALMTFSKEFKSNLLEGISGFQQKLASLSRWNKEDHEFALSYDSLVKSSLEFFRESENGHTFESECLSPQDATEVRQVLSVIFDRLNELKAIVSNENYTELSLQVAECSALVETTMEWRETREQCLNLRAELRESVLTKAQKDELFDKLNKALDLLSSRQSAEKQIFEAEAEKNHGNYDASIEECLEEAESTTEFQNTREKFKKIQLELREIKLTKDQRNELFDKLDKAFKILSQRQAAEREVFDRDSVVNYAALKERTETAKRLAQFSDDYQEVRDYLKDIQNDVRDLTLSREQREELRNEIREAFDKVNLRADRYYNDKRHSWEKKQKEMDDMRTKKRQDWEFRMKEKMVRLESTAKNLERAIQNDLDFAEGLKERLEDDSNASLAEKLANVERQIKERQGRVEEIRGEVREIEAKLAQE